ncbi:hypothetical protein L596_015186 [Steinernema carpocapsae]|uniref:Uncharacterized protein n=1 Tax=Steinernema carpocapsae TaxID=34508 RepID=A0A4U5NF51_STECR|nr:hypothetical protein L596_015186 [Steinernema carpocapsae]
MSTSALQISRWPSWLRLPRSKFIALAAGLSVLALGYLLNSEWKKRKTRRASGGADEEKNDVVQELRRGDANSICGS